MTDQGWRNLGRILAGVVGEQFVLALQARRDERHGWAALNMELDRIKERARPKPGVIGAQQVPTVRASDFWPPEGWRVRRKMIPYDLEQIVKNLMPKK